MKNEGRNTAAPSFMPKSEQHVFKHAARATKTTLNTIFQLKMMAFDLAHGLLNNREEKSVGKTQDTYCGTYSSGGSSMVRNACPESCN